MRYLPYILLFTITVVASAEEQKEKKPVDSSEVVKSRSKRQCGCMRQQPLQCSCRTYSGQQACGCTPYKPCGCSTQQNNSCGAVCQRSCQRSCVAQNQPVNACRDTCTRTCATSCVIAQQQQQGLMFAPSPTSTTTISSPLELKIVISDDKNTPCNSNCLNKCGTVCQSKQYPEQLCNNSCQSSCNAVCGMDRVSTTTTTTTQIPLRIEIKFAPQLAPITTSTSSPGLCMPACQQTCQENCGYTKETQASCSVTCDNSCQSLCNPQLSPPSPTQRPQQPRQPSPTLPPPTLAPPPVSYLEPVTTTAQPIRIFINTQPSTNSQCLSQCNTGCNDSCQKQRTQPVEGCPQSCDNTCKNVCQGSFGSVQQSPPASTVTSQQVAPQQRCKSECQNVCQLACVSQQNPIQKCASSCTPECDRACANPTVQLSSAQLFATIDPRKSLYDALTTTTVPPHVFDYTTTSVCVPACMPACQPTCTAMHEGTTTSPMQVRINLVTSKPTMSPEACAMYCSSACNAQCNCLNLFSIEGEGAAGTGLAGAGQGTRGGAEVNSDYRVAMFGAGGVGKSSIVQRFVNGTFSDNYVPTIEDTYRQVISCNQKNVCTLHITDTTGSHQFPAMQQLCMSKGNAFIFIYSITSKQSMEELGPIIKTLIEVKGQPQMKETPVILVGNKKDEDSKREVKTETAEKWATNLGWAFIETSAKNNENITEMFQKLLSLEKKRVLALSMEDPDAKNGKKKKCSVM